MKETPPYLRPIQTRQEKHARLAKRLTYFAAITIIAILIFSILASCQKKSNTYNAPSSVGSANTLLVKLQFKRVNSDSLYYSINLPCLAPANKTGFSRDSIKTWQCQGLPTGAFYNCSAQSSAQLGVKDSLILEIYINGSLKASGKGINIVSATLQY